MLANGLNKPVSLTVIGSTLYWVDSAGTANSTIQSVPVTGGTVSTLVTKASLAGDLASDGTKLYFGALDSGGNSFEIDSSGLDGSGVTALTTGQMGWTGPTSQNGTTDLMLVGSTLYFQCQPTNFLAEVLCSMPTIGGTPAPMWMTVENNVEYLVSALYVGTASGIVLWDVNSSLSTGMSSFSLGVEPLSGGAPSSLYTVPEASSTSMPMLNDGGGATVAGSNIVYLSQVSGQNEVFISSVPLAGGTPTQVADLKPWSAGFVAADASGMYVDQSIASDNPGIYTVSASGTPTLFQAAGVSSVDTGNPRQLVLDSTNLYWIAGGFNGGQASVHAKAR
jgi:hypothetical protein